MEGTNLLGKSHKKYVQDQIKIRQEKLGKVTKDSTDIQWMNGKTSWVRLASSVDVVNTTTRVSKEVLNDRTFTDQIQGISSNPNLQPTLANVFLNQTTTVTEDIPHTINGVKVGEKRLNLLGLDESFMGDTLSHKLVLHGGVEQAIFGEDNNSLFKRRGVTSKLGNSLASSTSTYSSKTGDFGLVAMPGLQSVDIKSKSMGSLREANVSIRVNDAEQLELIETVYLRLGYSMFLEWGNSSYYNNDGDYVKGAEVEPGLLYDFLKPEGTKLTECPQNFIKKIESTRKKSNGNYDALFGRVSNFSWEFDPSGFYNVTLTIISWGDIIESLKIDSLYPGVDINNPTNKNSVEKKDQSLLNSFVYEVSLPNSTTKKIETFSTKEGVTDKNITTTTVNPIKKNLISFISTSKDSFLFNTEDKVETQDASDYSEKLDYTRPVDFKNMAISGFASFGDNSKYYYVRFGDILEFIRKKLLVYVEGCETPITDINTATNFNFCYNPQINVSADPSKVMIRRTLPLTSKRLENLKTILQVESDITPTNKVFEGTLGSQNIQLEPFDKILQIEEDRIDIDIDDDGDIDQKDVPVFKKVTVGLLMNIYFEKEYLFKTIDQHRDNRTGRLSLYKFLKSLLDTANDCLGGVNKLDLRVKDDQTLEVYDQTPLYGVKEVEESPTIFNIFGLKPSTGEGSFVANFGLKTELTNDFATTIAIGAQANGSVVGEDSTMLSKWNFGLVDRFYPKKLDSYRKDNQQQSGDPDREEFETAVEKMYNLWVDYSIQQIGGLTTVDRDLGTSNVEGISGVYKFPQFNTNSLSEYVKIQKDFFQSIIKLKSKEQNVLSNQIGMLPINLNLEIDGLSGIRIYDQIHVDTRFLPSYYPDNLIFIIKGLSNTFNGNRWITKIDTIAQPKVQFSKELKLEVEADIEEILGDLADSATFNSGGEIPNATDLRGVLNELGYQEKGEEIANGGDISFDMKVASEAVFRYIKTTYPEISIVVTGGNDLYHQTLQANYVSLHTTGNALDFVISPPTEKNIKNVVTVLQEFTAGDVLQKFSFINEYANPTKKATGRHFHLVIGGGPAASSSRNLANALADEGKITRRSSTADFIQQGIIDELNRPF